MKKTVNWDEQPPASPRGGFHMSECNCVSCGKCAGAQEKAACIPKPCPFCGCEDTHVVDIMTDPWDVVTVECKSCEAQGPRVNNGGLNHRQEAVRSWNRVWDIPLEKTAVNEKSVVSCQKCSINDDCPGFESCPRLGLPETEYDYDLDSYAKDAFSVSIGVLEWCVFVGDGDEVGVDQAAYALRIGLTD